MAKSLQDIIRATFGVRTRPNDRADNVTVGAAVVSVLEYNPNRVGLVLQNNGATTLYIKTNRNLVVGTGIRLLPGGGSISFKWDEDFHKVCSNFFAIGSGAGGLLTIQEVLIYSGE